MPGGGFASTWLRSVSPRLCVQVRNNTALSQYIYSTGKHENGARDYVVVLHQQWLRHHRAQRMAHTHRKNETDTRTDTLRQRDCDGRFETLFQLCTQVIFQENLHSTLCLDASEASPLCVGHYPRVSENDQMAERTEYVRTAPTWSWQFFQPVLKKPFPSAFEKTQFRNPQGIIFPNEQSWVMTTRVYRIPWSALNTSPTWLLRRNSGPKGAYFVSTWLRFISLLDYS